MASASVSEVNRDKYHESVSLRRTDDNMFAQALQPHCFAPFSLTVDLQFPALNPKGEKRHEQFKFRCFQHFHKLLLLTEIVKG